MNMNNTLHKDFISCCQLSFFLSLFRFLFFCFVLWTDDKTRYQIFTVYTLLITERPAQFFRIENMSSFQNLKSPSLKNEILKLKGWLLGWLYNSKNVLLEMEVKTEIRIFWEETHCYIDLLCLLNFGNRFKIASSRLPLSLCVLFYLFYFFLISAVFYHWSETWYSKSWLFQRLEYQISHFLSQKHSLLAFTTFKLSN